MSANEDASRYNAQRGYVRAASLVGMFLCVKYAHIPVISDALNRALGTDPDARVEDFGVKCLAAGVAVVVFAVWRQSQPGAYAHQVATVKHADKWRDDDGTIKGDKEWQEYRQGEARWLSKLVVVGAGALACLWWLNFGGVR